MDLYSVNEFAFAAFSLVVRSDLAYFSPPYLKTTLQVLPRCSMEAMS